MVALAAWQRTITDSEGNGLAFAEIEVFYAGSGSKPTLYSDRSGTSTQTNPFSADSEGFARFFAAGDAYDIAVNGAVAWTFTPVGTMAELDRETVNNEGGVNYIQINAEAVILGYGNQMIRLDNLGATLAVRSLDFVEVP